MPLLDRQRKSQQIGRIRIGHKVVGQNGKERPAKLGTFRFTTGSRYTADAIAELFGGVVKPWERGQFEVITEKSEIPVMVPPRDGAISQWYEQWSKGGCQRRCDSVTDQISGDPCVCPSDSIERSRLAKLNPPRACKTVTRVSVMIPDLPGLGVFRLDTGSDYAAEELGDTAELMETARSSGVFVPAMLRIDQRMRVADGQTKHYPVPVLEAMRSARQILSGELAAGGMAAQLPPMPGEALRAITAGPTPEPPPRAAAGTEAAPDAQALADRAWVAQTKPDVMTLISQAKEHLLGEELVLVDAENAIYEELRAFLTARYNTLPAEAGAA